MKKIFFAFTLFFGTSLIVSAQSIAKKEVPPAVMRSYLAQNSRGALDSMWTRTTVTIYKVHFMDDGKRYEAQYFEDGSWIKTFTEIAQSDLLPGIITQVNQTYPSFKIERAAIELNNDGKFYAIDLIKGNDKLTIYFLMSGKFVK